MLFGVVFAAALLLGLALLEFVAFSGEFVEETTNAFRFLFAGWELLRVVEMLGVGGGVLGDLMEND